MIKVKFIKDFSNKLEGETGIYDSLLASQLVRIHKVAVYAKKTEEIEVVEPKTIKPKSKK